MKISKAQTPAELAVWDEYVRHHSYASAYHHSAWRHVIEKTYGHTCHYLVASDDVSSNLKSLRGVLPLVHIHSLVFGNKLVSLPYFDNAGVLYDTPAAGEALIEAAFDLGQQLGVDCVELRQSKDIEDILSQSSFSLKAAVFDAKVRMVMDLPQSSKALMASFKSKLRSQINNPIKKGLESRIGGLELLDDFYHIFSINMRDLGSPVHSIHLMRNTLKNCGEKARLFVIYEGQQPLAASLTLAYSSCLENPWASSLRRYSKSNANMLLYWKMLEYACHNGFAQFNFGRSSTDEGTFRFKQQWGAKPAPLLWYTFYSKSKNLSQPPQLDKHTFERWITLWQRLPVFITRMVGPFIRKRINL